MRQLSGPGISSNSRAACGAWLMALLVPFGMGCGGGKPGGIGPDGPDANDTLVRTAERGPVKLTVRVTPKAPRLSDLVEMSVVVEAPPGVHIKPPQFGQGVRDFLIRDYRERPLESGATEVRRFQYQLEPTQAGPHLIRSIAVTFVDQRPGSESGGELLLVETDPLEVPVSSELGEATPDLADLEPMLPPQPLPTCPATMWMWCGGLTLAVCGIGYWFWRRRRRREAAGPPPSPEELARAALEALLAEGLPARGMFKEFYLRLTGVVRQYIEDTTGLRAPEQTTEEFLRDMRERHPFNPARAARLAEFLEAADMVKYAGYQPQGAQVDDAIARAREFVDAPGGAPSASARFMVSRDREDESGNGVSSDERYAPTAERDR